MSSEILNPSYSLSIQTKYAEIKFIDDGIDWAKPFLNKSLQKNSILHAKVCITWLNGKTCDWNVHKIAPKLFNANKEVRKPFNKKEFSMEVISSDANKTEIDIKLKVEKSFGCTVCFYTISLFEDSDELCCTEKSSYFCIISNQSQEDNAIKVVRMNRIKRKDEDEVRTAVCTEIERSFLDRKRRISSYEADGVIEKYLKPIDDRSIGNFFMWMDETIKELNTTPFSELFVNGYIVCTLSSKCRKNVERGMEEGFFYITCSTKYPAKFNIVCKERGDVVIKRLFLIYNKDMNSVVNCLLRRDDLKKIGKITVSESTSISFVDKEELSSLIQPGEESGSYCPSDCEGDEYSVATPIFV